jgi:hypothetical protein
LPGQRHARRDRRLAPRRDELQQREHGEDAAERGKPDQGFACERDVAHWCDCSTILTGRALVLLFKQMIE